MSTTSLPKNWKSVRGNPNDYLLFTCTAEQVVRTYKTLFPTCVEGRLADAYYDLRLNGFFEKAEKILTAAKIHFQNKPWDNLKQELSQPYGHSIPFYRKVTDPFLP